MRLSGLAMVIILICFSCSGETEKKPTPKNPMQGVAADTLRHYSSFNFDTLKGVYIGKFGKDDIRLVLTYVSDAHLAGYNLLKGLQRNLSGSVKFSDSGIEMIANEPGDDKYDGRFEFILDTITYTIKGKWIANDPAITPKNFILNKLASNSDDTNINSGNFASYFYTVWVNSGQLHFEEDGFCRFEYYPENGDLEEMEQMQQVNGSWTLDKNILTVFWKENPIIPKQAVYQLRKLNDENYDVFVLMSADQDTIYPMYY